MKQRASFKKRIGAILSAVAVCAVTVFFSESRTVKASASGDTWTGKSASEIVDLMGVGFNIGNTLEATAGNGLSVYSQETSWGNCVITQALIDAIAEAGFRTVRIPVTWYTQMSDDGTYTINEEFINRVKEVVDYCYQDGLIVIVNLHHEEWINNDQLIENQEAIGEELKAVWTQLATAFADYDQHLIFEGMNEPRLAGTGAEWTGTTECYKVINYLNEIFVNTVRCEGSGYNYERCLMVPGYAASSSSNVLDSITIPTYRGEAVNNVIISVHAYTPYDFCLTDQTDEFDPESSASTGGIDSLFEDLKTKFLDQGIPVVIGETGATNTQNNTEAREKWAYYFASKSAAYGVPIILWDNGSNDLIGGENHSYINRMKAEWIKPTIIEALMDGFASVEWASVRTAETESEAATEEITADTELTYYANGVKYYKGTDYPTDPEYLNMVFEGWYATKDYQEDTAYDGAALSTGTKLYAKFSLDLDALGLVDNGPEDLSGGTSSKTRYITLAIVVVALMAYSFYNNKKRQRQEEQAQQRRPMTIREKAGLCENAEENDDSGAEN